KLNVTRDTRIAFSTKVQPKTFGGVGGTCGISRPRFRIWAFAENVGVQDRGGSHRQMRRRARVAAAAMRPSARATAGRFSTATLHGLDAGTPKTSSRSASARSAWATWSDHSCGTLTTIQMKAAINASWRIGRTNGFLVTLIASMVVK